MNNPSRIIRDRWGYLEQEELDALKKCIGSLPNGSICVNIGAGFGTSGLAFIESVNVAKLYTIDFYLRKEENGLGSLEFERDVFKEFGYTEGGRYVQVLGDSVIIGTTCQLENVNMIFVDGDHSYEHCHADVEVWLPRIKDGGIMSFHDYQEPRWPGVGQAIDELLTPRYKMIDTARKFIAFRIKK
jgi:predicted O-methyltransferase YrrM